AIQVGSKHGHRDMAHPRVPPVALLAPRHNRILLTLHTPADGRARSPHPLERAPGTAAGSTPRVRCAPCVVAAPSHTADMASVGARAADSARPWPRHNRPEKPSGHHGRVTGSQTS